MRKITLLLIALFSLIISPLVGPALAQTSSPFPDVSQEHIFADTLSEIGGDIVRGYGDGSAKPDQRMTREEAIVMVSRLLYSDEEMEACDASTVPFSGYSDWAANAICMLYNDGLVTGDDATGQLRPRDFVNLAEMDALLVRAVDISPVTTTGNDPWYAGNIRATEHLLHPTLTDFNSDMTRGQFAEMLYRYQDGKRNELHTTYQDLSSPLGTVESCRELEGLVKTAWKQSQYLGGYYYRPNVMVLEGEMMEDDVMQEAAPSANTAGLGGGRNKVSFSETNIQVQGVDEADVVKTDGEHIYTVQDNVIKIIQAQPENDMKELAQLKFDDFYPQEMYLSAQGDKKYLILAGGSRGYGLLAETQVADARIWPGFNGETHVRVLDVTHASEPKTLHRFTVEGYLSASRLLIDEGKAYFITNNSFDLWELDREAFKKLTGEQFLPLIQQGAGNAQPALDCAGIPYVKGFIQPQSVMVTSIDLEGGDLNSQMILGASAQTIYMSLKNLYLTQQSQNHLLYTDFAPERDKSSTQIFKLPLSLDQPALSAQVPGWLLNQFSLSEYNDHLRVATTEDDLWWRGNERSNGVYILNENMKRTGSVENLAPTERIYSARFMGDRGYLVTFRQVDPLFALDLSNPSDPEVIGELKIPGFSNYLHPFGENFLVGIGQDADEETGRTQGPKVSLFDVSDPENLQEVDSMVIGYRGYSEAFYNHKAVLFTEDKFGEGEALLAFPLEYWQELPDNPECSEMSVDSCDASTCEVVPTEPVCTPIEGGGEICSSQGNVCQSQTFSQQMFNGAVVFGVTESGLELKGEITHHVADEEVDSEEDYVDWRDQIYRTLWIDEVLYTLSRGNVWANDLMDLDMLLGKLKLTENL